MEELLFGSGSAIVKHGAMAILDSLSSVLKQLPFDLRVEGHTDDVPIRTAAFPSNWHLSVARAANAAHYMILQNGIIPERISVVGYAEYQPIAPNDSEVFRARNRRVDIVIVTDLPKEPASTHHLP
jgi:chemotaxis protein MotB